jgi:hypothetical protein
MKGLRPCLNQFLKNSLTVFCKEKLLEDIRIIFIGVL